MAVALALKGSLAAPSHPWHERVIQRKTKLFILEHFRQTPKYNTDRAGTLSPIAQFNKNQLWTVLCLTPTPPCRSWVISEQSPEILFYLKICVF
jgi:hypothetical protein